MIFTGEILSVLLEIGIHLSLWNPKLTVIGFTENHETRSVFGTKFNFRNMEEKS
jgi:hypothetical protein